MTDEEIIGLFFERSEQAVSELEEKHGHVVKQIAYNILGDMEDAKECTNDTWLAAWNSIPPQRPERLRSYVCRLARNLATKKYHSRHAQKRNSSYDIALDELAECIPGGPDPQRVLEANELMQAVNRFLAALKPLERDAFVARYFYAASLAELSARTGWTVGKTKTVLRRARLKLQTYLKEEGLC